MLDRILAIVAEVSASTPSIDENSTPKAIRIESADLIKVCTVLYSHTGTYFDLLSCVTGIDNGPEKNTMEVAYNLYSIPYDIHLMLKVTISRNGATVPSVSSIWKTANWHEREIFDLFGIVFTEHPDLRRILLPADWDGHPLRKDYKQQDYYKGIKTDY